MGLSEKMEYIGGIIPRGATKREYSVKSDNKIYEETIVELLNISGKGFITSLGCTAGAHAWYNTSNYVPQNASCTVSMRVICDGTEKISASASISASPDGITARDMESTNTCYIFDSEAFFIQDNTTNVLLSFEKSLIIQLTIKPTYLAQAPYNWVWGSISAICGVIE